jgi:ferredoxin
MSNAIDIQALPEVYRRLARHLDNLPAGFPPTDSGIELRILARLFTPEEAQAALALTMLPEPAASIAARLPGCDAQALETLLLEMSRKGLIYRSTRDGQHFFMAAQFVIGIWEYHVNSLDEELIRDVNAYLPTLMRKSWLGVNTKQLRVIPVNHQLQGGAQIMPYDQAETLIRQQSTIAVSPCICRREHTMVGKGCDKPLEVCLSFGGGARYYTENGLGRMISQDQALAILKTGIEAGLVLQPGNAQKPANICMCCPCCCQVLKNLKLLERPGELVHSSHVAAVSAENCTACGVCAERCPMQAITVTDVAQVNAARCIGCGLCAAACQFEAMQLLAKPEAQRYVPPKNIVETYVRIAQERGKL